MPSIVYKKISITYCGCYLYSPFMYTLFFVFRIQRLDQYQQPAYSQPKRPLASIYDIYLYVSVSRLWNIDICKVRFDMILFIVFNATFSSISAITWRPVFVVAEAGVPGENHRPWASKLYHLRLRVECTLFVI